MVYETTFTFRVDKVVKDDYDEYAKRGIIDREVMSQCLRLTLNIVLQELKKSPTSALYDALVVRNYELSKPIPNQAPTHIVEKDNTMKIEIKSEIKQEEAKKTGLDLDWLNINTKGDE